MFVVPGARLNLLSPLLSRCKSKANQGLGIDNAHGAVLRSWSPGATSSAQIPRRHAINALARTSIRHPEHRPALPFPGPLLQLVLDTTPSTDVRVNGLCAGVCELPCEEGVDVREG